MWYEKKTNLQDVKLYCLRKFSNLKSMFGTEMGKFVFHFII